MPVHPNEILVGSAGKLYIEQNTNPKFIFTALTELEDLFVMRIKQKLLEFKNDLELSDPPPVVPAYAPGDRKFYVILVEAQLNNSSAQGIGYNEREFQFQPNPDDANTLLTFIERSGNAEYTVEVFARAGTRATVSYIADWVFAALNDPRAKSLDGGIQIPYNAIRFSGKAQEFSMQQGAPTQLDKFFQINFTVPGIIVPWQRMYQVDGPDFTTWEFEIAVES